MKAIIHFFDKLEDKVRGRLSHYPILYGIVGAIGTVLMWRGIWHTADFLSSRYFHPAAGAMGVIDASIDGPFLWDGFISLVLGLVMLLMTGLFVAAFIGDHVIISGLRHEKKVTEKTEEEVEEEESIIKKVHEELHGIGKRLEDIEARLDKKG